MDRLACWRVALGQEPADLIIRGGKVVDVHTGEVYAADIAVKGKRIAAVGDVAYTAGPETRYFDASGKFLTPTFIEGHMHASGCLTNLTELARVLVAHGTTVICTDLYEAAVSGGLEGMRFCVDELNRTPLQILLTVGYQMYLQNQQFGHTGKITGEDMLACYEWPETIGISEWIYHFAGRNDPYIQELYARMWRDRKVFVGHANSYPTRAVQSYAALAAYSDHESGTADEALEKIRSGYKIMIRQYGTEDSAMRDILKLVTERGIESRYLSFSTDHDDPYSLQTRGHLDAQIRIAIALGISPVTAIQMASLNNAEYFRIQDDYGSLAPGKMADLCVVDRLDESFPISAVFAKGSLVAENYKYAAELSRPEYPAWWYKTINIGRAVTAEDLRYEAPPGRTEATVRVIGYTKPPGSESRSAVLPVADGCVHADVSRDILKMVVFDRHHASGKVGKGFIQGIGLKAGAVGSSWTLGVADVSVIGTNDRDIAAVANCIAEMGGGLAAAKNGEIIAKLEMPLLGVMAADPLETLVEKLHLMEEAVVQQLGGPADVWHPIALVSMPRAIPSLKICHNGLVDVAPTRAEPVDLFLN